MTFPGFITRKHPVVPERRLEVSDWQKIDLENAKFILNQGTEYVKYLSEVNEKTTTRVFTLLSILLPIESALIAFLISATLKDSIDDYVLSDLILFEIFAIIVVMFVLGSIALPRLYKPVGREPYEIWQNEQLLGIDYDKAKAQLSIILNELDNCQSKIQYNQQKNHGRIQKLKICMLAIGVLLMVAVITLSLHFL